ncbi:MAG: RNA polymerase sigma factor [Gammaproteobacteria bacterium]|nr:RNA polymerase sigma factor [Gammaproteobacteria bacterium]
MTDRDLLQAGFRYAFSLANRHHDAEDLVQEAWLRISALHGSVPNKSLLFTVIRNIFIDQYRRKNLVIIESLEGVAEPAQLDAGQEFNIDSKVLDKALNNLRPEEREAIFLNIIEGYTAKEIAKLTDKSRNTILSLLHRGKQKLVQQLGQESNDGQYLA